MEVEFAQREAPLRLRAALLVHESGGGYRSSAFVTLHGLVEREGAAPVIGPGRVVGLGEIQSALCKAGGVPSLSFLDERILARSDNTLVWWRPSQPARVWFNVADDERLRNRTAVTPQPSLVFAVQGGTFSLWALDEATRPRPTSRLFQAPFMNVWETGRICTGQADLPASLPASAEQAMELYERGFWQSRFTHPNVHRPRSLVRWRGGVHGLWRGLLSGRHKVFPNRCLVGTGLTLGDLLNRMGRGNV